MDTLYQQLNFRLSIRGADKLLLNLFDIVHCQRFSQLWRGGQAVAILDPSIKPTQTRLMNSLSNRTTALTAKAPRLSIDSRLYRFIAGKRQLAMITMGFSAIITIN